VAQVASGGAAYSASCASYHGADLSGSANAPTLVAGLFLGGWGDKAAAQLVSFLQGSMPPANPDSLGEQTYTNIAAFILDANGARNSGLTSVIRAVATGPRPAQPASVFNNSRAEAAAHPIPRGLVVTGEVKNHMPVTDAMLRNPDPGDWLMIRHDYQAHNYSPLSQINTTNVKDLQLAWGWAMNEGTNQAAPVVHGGVMYLNNPGNIVQALDARTGDLIWENRIGESSTGSSQRGRIRLSPGDKFEARYRGLYWFQKMDISQRKAGHAKQFPAGGCDCRSQCCADRTRSGRKH
jgi:alcohol dehydrogenase (cytochrome c)